MSAVASVLLAAFTCYYTGVFVEDAVLWERVDVLNSRLSGTAELESESLEELFGEALEIALSPAFESQFEDLRTDAFVIGSDETRLLYRDRAAPAITVLLMGESDNAGVNVAHFRTRSEPGSEAFLFFSIASDGFYVDGEQGRIGTAGLPVWMERFESSAQALVNPEAAAEWLCVWEAQSEYFDGLFHTIARETVEGLGGELAP